MKNKCEYTAYNVLIINVFHFTVKIICVYPCPARSERAGLLFPVGRAHRFLRDGKYAERVGSGAPVYMMGVIEYLVAEILELAGNAAIENKKRRIVPRHLTLAIRQDDELNLVFRNVIISDGGVMPNIQPILLPKKTSKKSAGHDSIGAGPSTSSQEY